MPSSTRCFSVTTIPLRPRLPLPSLSAQPKLPAAPLPWFLPPALHLRILCWFGFGVFSSATRELRPVAEAGATPTLTLSFPPELAALPFTGGARVSGSPGISAKHDPVAKVRNGDPARYAGTCAWAPIVANTSIDIRDGRLMRLV